MIRLYYILIVVLSGILVLLCPWINSAIIPCSTLWDMPENAFFPDWAAHYRTSNHHQLGQSLLAQLSTPLERIKSSPLLKTVPQTKSVTVNRKTKVNPIPRVHYADIVTTTTTSKPDVKSVSFTNFLGKLNPPENIKPPFKLNLTEEDEWRTLPEELILQHTPSFGGEHYDTAGLATIDDDLVESIRKSNKVTPEGFELDPDMEVMDSDYMNEDWINEIANGMGFDGVLEKDLVEEGEADGDREPIVDQTEGKDDNLDDYDDEMVESPPPKQKKKIPKILPVSNFQPKSPNYKVEDDQQSTPDKDQANHQAWYEETNLPFGQRKRPVIRGLTTTLRMPMLSGSPQLISRLKNKQLSDRKRRLQSYQIGGGKFFGVKRLAPMIQAASKTVKRKQQQQQKRKSPKSIELIKSLKIRKRKKKPNKTIRLIPVPESDFIIDGDAVGVPKVKRKKSKIGKPGYIVVPRSSKKHKDTDYFPYQYNVEMRSRRSKKDPKSKNNYKMHEQKEEEHWHEKKWKKGELTNSAEYGEQDESKHNLFHLDPDLFGPDEDETSATEDSSHYNIPSNGFRVDKRFINWVEKQID